MDIQVRENGKEENSLDGESSQVSCQLLSSSVTRYHLSISIIVSATDPYLGKMGVGGGCVCVCGGVKTAGCICPSALSQMHPSCQGKRSKCLIIYQLWWTEN